MKTRIISGLVMAPLLVVLYLGGWWLWAAALLIAVMGLQEFYKGWDNIDVHPSATIGYIMTVLLFVTAVPLSIGEKGAVPQFYENMMVICIWLFLAVATGLIYGWKIDKRGPYDAITTVTGLVYIPFFTYHMILIDMTEYRLFIWIVVIAAFGSDIFAYFTGYFLGKHKMAPVLSPKKTIEGAVGGLIGSSLLAWVFGLIFMKNIALVCLVLGLVGGAAGMAGDLTASAFKRKMGIKDYGKLIPGHGGIMDRFDSVIFVAPVVYYAICAMTGILSV
ncbi:MAG: phosphatidate cytidylyltransferase [Clostridiales bacterium]|nr:phosphatidate cytidylyltransferase [Clostridiales bacterium]